MWASRSSEMFRYFLAAPARGAAVAALVATAVPGHDATAFGAARGIRLHRFFEGQLRLRVGFGAF